MCGIAGIVGTSGVNQRIYDALTVLQHRGQDAAGIATVADGELFMRKGQGLVRDVFEQHHMQELKGNIGMGHVRYPTAGCDSASEAQPFYVNAPYGICLAHNGNLTNARELGRSARARRPPPSQHQLRFRSAAQRAGFRAAARGHAARHAGRHLRGRERGVSPLPRRLRGRRDDHRPRPARLPRSERHPSAGAGPARDAEGRRMDAGLRERRARHARLQAGARRRAGRSGVHRHATAACIRRSAWPPRAMRRASSSTCTSRVPTR